MARPQGILPGMAGLVLYKMPARLVSMWALNGRREGETCGSCRHLLRRRCGKRVYLKCGLTAWTCGPGTDWRAGWTACGRFEGVGNACDCVQETQTG